ncbi:MAG: ABC transporter permease [Chloroflexi bacterium]|nr:ABC transporter permease [Chloroflexota bacterium]
MGRLVSLLPVMLVVVVVAFLLLRLMPGDPATAMLPITAQLWEIEELRSQLGLDRPLPIQFLHFLGRTVRGDLGESLFFRIPVSELISQRFESTFLLAGTSMLLAVLIGVPVGVWAANRRGTLLDQLLMASSLISVSMPSFWLGLILILAFAVHRPWFPVTGWTSISENPMKTMRFLVLPTVTMGLSVAAVIARMVRSSMLEVLSQDYIRTGRAKGMAYRWLLYKHALRNAMIPMMAAIGLSFAGLLGGAAVTETVFTIPGLGSLMVDSVARRDYPVLQALLILFALINMLVHLIIDLSYVLVDPRIRID